MSDVKNSGLVTNLTSYWELEESSGTRSDSHGSNSLTDYNTVTQGTGKQGSCADFEASNSEVLYNSSPSGIFTTGNWSLSLWYKPESLSNGAVFGVSTNSDNDVFIQAFILSSKFYIRRQNAPSFYEDITTSLTLSVGTWYHLVIAFDTTSGTTIYVNNSSVGSSSNTGLPDSASRYLVLGGRFRAPYDFFGDGLIDEVGWWTGRALSSSDVSSLYNSGNGIPYDAGGAGGSTFTPKAIII